MAGVSRTYGWISDVSSVIPGKVGIRYLNQLSQNGPEPGGTVSGGVALEVGDPGTRAFGSGSGPGAEGGVFHQPLPSATKS